MLDFNSINHFVFNFLINLIFLFL